MSTTSRYLPLPRGTSALSLGGTLRYEPGWLTPARATALMSEVTQLATFVRETISVPGGPVPQPRDTAWFLRRFAAANRYRVATPAAAPGPLLTELLKEIESQLDWRPNAILLNRYPDGAASVGWHADNEPTLGAAPTILSISLGGTRRFMIKPKVSAASPERFDVQLRHGDLLVMEGAMQKSYVHQIPKCASADPRINITARRYLI